MELFAQATDLCGSAPMAHAKSRLALWQNSTSSGTPSAQSGDETQAKREIQITLANEPSYERSLWSRPSNALVRESHEIVAPVDGCIHLISGHRSGSGRRADYQQVAAFSTARQELI
jgi:hypothetical protein